MPRPAARPTIAPSTLAPQTIPNDLVVLRRQWKWAAFCQFFSTFAPLFAMDEVTVGDIEHDLVHSTSVVIPRIMQRLLYCLSYDRKVSLDNWQTALRKQYYKRDPQANPLGGDVPMDRYSKSVEPTALTPGPKSETDDDVNLGGSGDVLPGEEQLREHKATSPADSIPLPETKQVSVSDSGGEGIKDWLQLPMLEKLDSMHLLTEWQFQNPTRLRQIMKTDDEAATWRVEPIGFDVRKNAYWLIGEDRLWIQRCPPRPNLKRKRVILKLNPKPTKASNKRSRVELFKPARQAFRREEAIPTGRGGGRAAKMQAKLKLDAQAKELAELNKQAASSKGTPHKARANPQNSSPTPSKLPGRPVNNSRPAGTRLSLRLRGSMAGEWQPIPTEWLEESESKQPVKRKTGLENDLESISDLTELSEESPSEHPSPDHDHDAEEEEEPPVQEPIQEPEELLEVTGKNEAPECPADFIEWETIAVTLDEWEHVADPFTQAGHYSEKALRKVLNVIAPIIIEQLREVEKNRRLEEAVTHRKRSSRIAVKESEKEEARLAAKKRAEEEEKFSRARRAEARQQKEEADRQRRETAREARRREREAKEALHKSTTEVSTPDEGDVKEPAANGTQQSKRTNGSGSGSRTPNSDWELDCEICQRRGANVDDGTPMMSCGSCSKWQHISCHDRADQASGRSKRNWDDVEFFCYKCRVKSQGQPGRSNGTVTSQSIQLSAPYRTNGGYTSKAPGTAVPTYQVPYSVPNYYSQNAQAPLTFSHYQPEQRVFMPSQMHQPYGSSLTHQPYGGTMNGHAANPQTWQPPHPQLSDPHPGVPTFPSGSSGVAPLFAQHPFPPQPPRHPSLPHQPAHPPHMPPSQLPSQHPYYPT
ncbi:hypothetical protein BDN71DRAFT_1508624 [Pleurotus eryngii]|uniref:Zinc finger PHD-type domain-containing protein n=1 Tax=Pleurotus eryngii TaxID=5323 RepID=A0A9P6DEM2_PLEER|nr:hypothetical protein BDN71DRAFT_1508624 [Pleurotus eryngii]